MTDEGRRVVLAGALNFRDLGGLPLRGGGAVRRGVLHRSDSLHALTVSDLARVHDQLGLRTVVDLRMDEEVEQLCPPPGAFREHVRLVRLPFFTSLRPEWQDAAGWATEELRAQRYYEFATAGAPAMVELLRLVADGQRTPAVIHCRSGRDRTGVAVALLLDLVGVERAAIGADYAVTGRYITDHELAPERVVRMLELVDERHGSVAGFLREHGAGADGVAAARVALRDL